jgi:hypothetical protein
MTSGDFLRGDKILSQLTRDELCDLIDNKDTPGWLREILIAELLRRINMSVSGAQMHQEFYRQKS